MCEKVTVVPRCRPDSFSARFGTSFEAYPGQDNSPTPYTSLFSPITERKTLAFSDHYASTHIYSPIVKLSRPDPLKMVRVRFYLWRPGPRLRVAFQSDSQKRTALESDRISPSHVRIWRFLYAKVGYETEGPEMWCRFEEPDRRVNLFRLADFQQPKRPSRWVPFVVISTTATAEDFASVVGLS